MAALVPHPRVAEPEPDTPRKPLTKNVPLDVLLTLTGTPQLAWDSDGSGLDAAFLVDLTTDKDVWLAFNAISGTPDSTNAFRLNGGESYNPNGLVVVYSILFVNANAAETPTLRGILWGN